jgi:BirA family biotin operon repressor/biotin-[acetyl-CoA-carboxylase] ligase
VKLGETRIHVESCESTQALLDPSMAEGTVAVADVQTAGRGRLGRTWEAPPRSAVLVSVLLRPSADRPLPQLALVAGVAVADALEELTGLSVQIKWPNDVMLRRTKVAGILAEARESAVVVGIGVNVNQTREQLPNRGGSLRTATGLEWDRDAVLDAVLGALGTRYDLRGRSVTVDDTSGTAELIDRDGRLRIAVGHGESVTVESGEVTYEH